MTFRAYMIKIQFESRPGLKSEYNDSLLFMVLYREALDRLCVRLNMYLVGYYMGLRLIMHIGPLTLTLVYFVH